MQTNKSKVIKRKVLRRQNLTKPVSKNSIESKKKSLKKIVKSKPLKPNQLRKQSINNQITKGKLFRQKNNRNNTKSEYVLSFIDKFKNFFKKNENEKPDKVLLIIFMFLVITGLFVVLDTSQVFAQREFNNKYHFLILHLLWVGVGFIGFLFAYSINYKIIRKFILPLYIATIFLLILTLFTTKINGASSWISLGGFTIQPSELAKLTFVLYIAGHLSVPKKWTNRKEFIINDFLPFFFLLIFIVGFVVIGKDLGTSIIIVSVALFIYFYKSTTKMEYIAFFCLLIFFFVGGIGLITAESYRNNRVKVYTNLLLHDNFGSKTDEMNSGYQMKQVILALGTGGWFGVGIGESLQKYDLVETTPATDSVIAILAEELGFVGVLVTLSIFAVFLFRGFRISSYTKDRYGQIVAIGITSWFGMQVFLHISSNVVVTPLTGVPLPFLSYGGSSTISIMVASGILLNISKYRTKTT